MLLQLLRQNDVIAGRQYTSSLLSVVAAAAAATEAGCWIFTQGKRQTQRDTATN